MIILRFPTALTGSSCLAAVGTPAAPNIMITAASVQDERVAAGRATQVPAARSTQRDRLPAAAARSATGPAAGLGSRHHHGRRAAHPGGPAPCPARPPAARSKPVLTRP